MKLNDEFIHFRFSYLGLDNLIVTLLTFSTTYLSYSDAV